MQYFMFLECFVIILSRDWSHFKPSNSESHRVLTYSVTNTLLLYQLLSFVIMKMCLEEDITPQKVNCNLKSRKRWRFL